MNEHYKGKDFALIGIHVDEEIPKDFCRAAGRISDQISKACQLLNLKMMGDYAVSMYPTKVLIDKEGVVRKISVMISRATIDKYL
ncbi:MAG: hypothetical protein R2688_04215 [Fimbriimonadaceae bacterium]